MLGETYFTSIRPDYVVVGWFARYSQLYDIDYLMKHGELVAIFGDGDWRYDVYRLD
jgi:hypothetical protein